MSVFTDNDDRYTNMSSDNFMDQEKKVFRRNIPLLISTGLTAAALSYFTIDKNVNNAVTRGLYMAVIAFLGASVVQVLEDNDYLDSTTNAPRYVEVLATGLIYYYARRRTFDVPSINSPALRTGMLAALVGQLTTPMMTKWLSKDKPRQE